MPLLAIAAAIAAALGLRAVKRRRAQKKIPGADFSRWKKGSRRSWWPFGMDW